MSDGQFFVKKTGRLQSIFGREGHNRRFHGGNIFNDVGTGIIWVKNHI